MKRPKINKTIKSYSSKLRFILQYLRSNIATIFMGNTYKFPQVFIELTIFLFFRYLYGNVMNCTKYNIIDINKNQIKN